MSGHSHWKKVKYRKAITDVKKSKIFSKLSRAISVAAREKDPDPETNPKLKLAIEMARSFNLPKENIERAIKKGAGKLEKIKLEEIMFEAYGPGGIAIIIEGITDNKNRALTEIKQILNQNSGKLADPGSVRWLFERKGVITISVSQPSVINREDLELKVIEAGAEDIYWHNAAREDEPPAEGEVRQGRRQGRDILDVYTKIEDLEKVKKNLETQEIKVTSCSLDWVAKNFVQVEEKNRESAKRLFETLDESEVVQEIYSNLKI
ncbi:YebC/PmpR family DNA-binding transcriptional regulator [Patescibacteria group bacterium]|nr:YebC/PmpR family DNA-binding transcriptional regulator [Patescibacteria group bacterium]